MKEYNLKYKMKRDDIWTAGPLENGVKFSSSFFILTKAQSLQGEKMKKKNGNFNHACTEANIELWIASRMIDPVMQVKNERPLVLFPFFVRFLKFSWIVSRLWKS